MNYLRASIVTKTTSIQYNTAHCNIPLLYLEIHSTPGTEFKLFILFQISCLVILSLLLRAHVFFYSVLLLWIDAIRASSGNQSLLQNKTKQREIRYYKWNSLMLERILISYQNRIWMRHWIKMNIFICCEECLVI